MRAAVREAFVPFSTDFEGMLPFMYLDQHRDPVTKALDPLVTCGMGNLVEPISEAVRLAWTVLGFRAAGPDEIREAWAKVKARKDLALQGGKAFKNVTELRLSQDAIDKLIDERLASNEVELLKFFPKLDAWCADAQLALHSMAWAMGGDFDQHDRWPAFTAACNASPPNWLEAAIQSHMSNGAPKRNAANYSLFVNAAVVDADGLNPDLLIWPAKLSLDAPPPDCAA